MGEGAGAASERALCYGDERHGDMQPRDAVVAKMGGREDLGSPPAEPWSKWNGGLTSHLRVDDGLSPWLARTRIAVGGPRGTSAASLIVEAYGDAVIPQITEAIGRAILKVERALAIVEDV